MSANGVLTVDLRAWSRATSTPWSSGSRVQARPVADKASDRAPGGRVSSGTAILDKAQLKIGEEDKVHRSVRLDDPSFGRPVDVILVAVDKVEAMTWSRSNGSGEDQGGQPVPPIWRGGRDAPGGFVGKVGGRSWRRLGTRGRRRLDGGHDHALRLVRRDHRLHRAQRA